ncbi:MAG: TlpA family protein disulfide reductase [Bacteroidetes bacterium]|nr:TlpA family protein disulfide reductase [Bacteroidota bacterium]
MYKYLSLLTLSVVLFSCTTEPVQKTNAKLSGNIDGLKNQTLILVGKTKTDTLKTDSIGNFNFEKDYSTPTYFKLYLGRKNISLYLTNKTDLSFTTSKNNFSEDIVFKGNGAEENILLNKRAKLTETKKYIYSLYPLSPDEFITKSDSAKQVLLDLSNKYAKSENVDSTFLNTINADILYGQLLEWSMYTEYHQYLAKEEAHLPKDSKQAIEKAVVSNNAFSNSDKYIEFMSDQIHKEYITLHPTTDSDDYNYDLPKYLGWINTRIASNKIKNDLFYKAIKFEITYSSESDRDKIYSTFTELNTNSSYQKSIDKVYASFEKLRKGKPAAQWSYPDINGKEYSLSDFKGKYVYIDVWATWCGPCKAEIPELAKLVKDYKNKDIVFVSVSIDDNKGAWEKMLKKENFNWIQIHAKKAWKSKIVSENGIRGIPRFMMVDKEGNIVDVNAPQPSSEDIRPLIDELLGKK